jgi:nitrate reductase gamma subunit
MTSLDHFFFVVFPYIVIAVFLVAAIYRYRSSSFGYSSLSSQFLEGKRGFWGSVPFHWAILMLFLGHLLMFLFPQGVLLWNSNPERLIAHEVVAFTFGMVAFVGLLVLIVRRLSTARLRVVTSPMDLVIELLLLAQIFLGCWIALGYRWGSSWFAADLSPYLWSIFKLDPQADAVSAMPLVIKLHIVAAFLIFLLIPFSRLVHFLVAPFHYIWRPYQVVIWYWDRKRIRQPDTAWAGNRPRDT